MNTTEYVKQVESLVAKAECGFFLTPPDCRNDGFDIAVAQHERPTSELRTALQGKALINEIFASGAFCGYHIIPIPTGDECLRLCQHSGCYGPWYHVSRYARTKSGAWKQVDQWGHYNYRKAHELGLEFGRPGRDLTDAERDTFQKRRAIMQKKLAENDGHISLSDLDKAYADAGV